MILLGLGSRLPRWAGNIGEWMNEIGWSGVRKRLMIGDLSDSL